MASLHRRPATSAMFAFLAMLLAIASGQNAIDNTNDNHNNHNNYGFLYNENGEDQYRHNGQYLSDWNQDWAKMSGRMVPKKCVPIPDNLTLCSDIGYKNMLLPNLLEQNSLEEVTQQAGSWIPLVRIECHPDTKVFLCSLFSPVCLERVIYPCRSLCEGVHNACIGRMRRYRFGWPEMLECDRFPVDHDLCIKLMHDIKADNNCSACKHPLNHESLIDHFCRTEIVMKATVKHFLDDNFGHRQLILRKKRKFYKHQNMSKSEARRLIPLIEDGATCSCKTINATQERYLLMGNRVGDKLVIKFGMVWKKKDKEFRKGIRAIRKSSKCEGIFRELSAAGTDKNGHRNETMKGEGRRGGKKRGKGRWKKKGGKKGKKNRKRKGRKGKRNKKDRKRKGRKDKKDKKGRKSKSKKKQNKAEDQSRRQAEDQALRNLMKLDN